MWIRVCKVMMKRLLLSEKIGEYSILTDSKEHPIPSHFYGICFELNSGVCGIDLSICITCLTQKCHVNYIIFWKIKSYESVSLGKV
jgi:hypothetical protein